MDNGVGMDCGSWGQAGWRGTKRKNGTSVTTQTIKHQNEKKDFFNSVKTPPLILSQIFSKSGEFYKMNKKD